MGKTGRSRNTLRTGAFVLVLSVVGMLSACSSRLTAPEQDPNAAITVFAASSLTGAFEEIGSAYRAANPDRKVTFNFAASSELVTQINEGAPADVFASADQKNMGRIATGTIGQPVVFATNRLEIVVRSGNPKGIATLADLAKPGILYVTAAADVPIGKYARQVLDAAGVTVTPQSLEANVKAIVSKVALGEADAGIVYVTDVLAAGAKVQGIKIPVGSNVVAEYPIAVPASTKAQDAASAFVAFVRSAAGQSILAKYGFGNP